MKQQVGLFFIINEKILFHGCTFEEAENYGDFKIYDKSHFDIWEEFYFKTYEVDYDYYPRGRIVYNKNLEKFWIYKDSCIADEMIAEWLEDYQQAEIKEDEHYKCHCCSKFYVVV